MIECYRGVVHPWLCDAMGHLSTRHYVAMFDDAAYHLFAAIGFTQEHIKRGVGLADVETTMRYKAELHAGALVLIRGTVRKVGRTSLSAHYAMERISDGALVAEMDTVSVQFDLSRRSAMPIVEEIRIKAEALLAG